MYLSIYLSTVFIYPSIYLSTVSISPSLYLLRMVSMMNDVYYIPQVVHVWSTSPASASSSSTARSSTTYDCLVVHICDIDIIVYDIDSSIDPLIRKQALKKILLTKNNSLRFFFLPAGSSIRHPHFGKRPMSTRHFLEIDPEIWHTPSSMSPCQAVDDCCFPLFSARHVFFPIFFDIWGSRDPKFPAKKQNRQRLGRAPWNTCANKQDLHEYLQRTAWKFGL